VQTANGKVTEKSDWKRIAIIAALSGGVALSIGMILALVVRRYTRTKGKASGNETHGNASGRDMQNPYAAIPAPPSTSKSRNGYPGALLPS
jgi:hypothetical protein